GLDNDGIEHFIHHHLPYLRTLPTAIIANIAGKNEAEFADMAKRLEGEPGLSGLELNLSCPNVAGGVDFAVDPEVTRRVVHRVREVCSLPLLAKLTPNATDIVAIAQAAAEGGADDVMEFLLAGASAVQLGTVNFYDPTASVRIVDQLPAALGQLGAASVADVVGTLRMDITP